ncbi:DUF5522 domain-containing protein [Bacteriovorax sp. Seq25_V]|uniref:DUF5522 domain-containing protein n=1 Tax=Bacteriovorax sp. Seq25_V TaxID=1201288 RepID=UPI000389EC3F|nr:DUF5522 domain-containing protein [Bacteriovorax sp. Seq25_V]EQC47463.1 hypothetical protein M900_0955 [Bacteriovorax sp. Seq25_V]
MELTYSKDGRDIKTSHFLRKRGSCCKTSCLHCPYGFTVKKEGLQFEVVDDSNFQEALEIFTIHIPDEPEIASSILASAFGKPKKVEKLSNLNMSKFRLVKIKGETCALVKVFNFQVLELYHVKHFEDQGLDIDTISGLL